MDGLNQGFVDDFNWVEASVWLLVAACFFIHVLRHRRPLPKLALVAGLLFLLFGISDIVETRTGAWWRPWWLGMWKGSCIFGFFMAYGRYRPTPPDEPAFQGHLKPAILTSIVLGVAFSVIAWFRFDNPAAMNTPADYYHAALSSLMTIEGAGLRGLHWSRFSILSDGFADGEWMYHLLLMPFWSLPPELAMRAAAAFTLGATLGVTSFLSCRWLGRAGLLVPLVVMLVAGMPTRIVLNPDGVAALLLLLAAYLTGRGALWALAAVGVLMALSHSAWHILLILCLTAFLWQWTRTRQPLWGLIGFPAFGLLLGVSVHPAFPNNVGIWLTSHGNGNGLEMPGDPVRTALLLSSATGLAILTWTLKSRQMENRNDQSIYATSFASLLVMAVLPRHTAMLCPVVILAVLVALTRNRLRLGVRCGAFHRVALLAGAILICLGMWQRRHEEWQDALNPVPFRDKTELHALSQNLPPGAKVAAPLEMTPLLAFAAPQAKYLNLLNLDFMMHRQPDLALAESELFSGRSPDPVQLVNKTFDSEYIAFSPGLHPRLETQLRGHSSFDKVHTSESVSLYRLVPAP